MVKRLTLPVPAYLKKFLENGDYEVDKKGRVLVEKWSELGKLITLTSRIVPFTQKPVQVKENEPSVALQYYCREKGYEVPTDKVPMLIKQLDEIFRREMVCEVRKVHELVGGDYSPWINAFLERFDIVPDVDVDWQTIRKIYRDYLAKTEKKNQKIAA